MRLRSCRVAVLYVFVTFLGLFEIASALADGQVEIRVTDHQAGIGNFHELQISIAEILLHKSGQDRRDGWMSILRESRSVDIVPLKDGKWESIGVVQVPPGRYDAIRVRANAREARYKSGRQFPLHSLNTVLASPIEIKEGIKSTVLVDFYVEDQTEHLPPRYVLKLRRVVPNP